MPEIDGLPGQFEAFVERTRTVLAREITAAKNAAAAAKAETATAQATLSQLQDQRAQTQRQLDTILAHLNKAASLGSIDAEILKAQKDLAALNVEKGKVATALEKLTQERREREAQINSLGNEVQRLLAIRSESEAVMANLRKQVGLVQSGQRQ
jgi:chromosome segregation ATPase